MDSQIYNKCNIITKSGVRCNRDANLVNIERTRFGMKCSYKNRQFSQGEYLQLMDKNGVWKNVCSLHFNSYHDNNRIPIFN